jgi:hypothetical protein
MLLSLTSRKIACALAYALIFPLTNLVGGGISLFGIVATLPFLPLAWVAGMAAVSLTQSEHAYLVGASLAVFLQVILILSISAYFLRRRNVDART